MSALLLFGLAGVALALVTLGSFSLLATKSFPPQVTSILCGIGAALAFLAIVSDAAPALLHLKLGLPGVGMSVALDGVSALFLLFLFIAGAACLAVSPVIPILIGASAATMLAADGFLLVLAFQSTIAAVAALVLAGPGRIHPTPALFAALALTAAMALLAPSLAELSFAAIRAHPPHGARASAAFVLTLIAAGGAVGMAPLHRWLRRAQTATSGAEAALLSGAVPALGIYLLARILLDLVGPTQPGWWGAVLVALGGAGALISAATMMISVEIRAVAAAASALRGGLAAIGIGVALVARAVDLAPLAALALAAAFLLVASQMLAGTLMSLVVGAAEAGAGTRRLDRLGGLLRSMPQTTACMLVAGASLAAVPPSLGFAGSWTLFEALLGAARVGGFGWQAVATLATLALAGTITLASVASVRLIGIGFLGRPRTPRTAAAQDPAQPVRIAMITLAVLALAAGVLPGIVISLAAPALRLLVGVDLFDRAGWLTLAPAPQSPGLTAAMLALLLIAITVAILRVQRIKAQIGQHIGPPWEGGGDAPPPWLPFGDPATQIGPIGFAAAVTSMLVALTPTPALRLRPLLRGWHRLTARANRLWQLPFGDALAALLAVAGLLFALVLVQ